MADYQIATIILAVFMYSVCAWLIIFFTFSVIKYGEFRKGLVEAIQDGDNIFHWKDAKSAAFLVAGSISAMFTMGITLIFIYANKIDTGAIALIGLFTAITFTLWGIAWKK